MPPSLNKPVCLIAAIFACSILFSSCESNEELLRVARRGRDVDERLKAIEGITNQKYLFDLATDSSMGRNERTTAVMAIEDEQLLSKLVYDRDGAIRQNAINNQHLSDQTILLNIATQDKDKYMRREAISKLTDQNALLKIVETETDQTARAIAIRTLTNLDDLIKIAQMGWTYDDRLQAAYRIYLLDIDKKDESKWHTDGVAANVMLVLLDPEVFKRHGMLHLEYVNKQQMTKYEGGRYLYTNDFTVKIHSSKRKLLFERQYAAVPAQQKEEFYSDVKVRNRGADFNYNEIKRRLLEIEADR